MLSTFLPAPDDLPGSVPLVIGSSFCKKCGRYKPISKLRETY
ncbi:hypothetical protein CEV31_1640 [Brucella thiophenivorans]|uniref:Uncharacterized protein n=1 Tax=Brucella thiophenivorans TaxID=571255 RepID=A0A256FZE6_9HYPH|nr:hypothetical protein CEV31_1640 [Brucella thiophenivorans]